MHCPECGKKNNLKNKHCVGCGFKLTKLKEDEKVASPRKFFVIFWLTAIFVFVVQIIIIITLPSDKNYTTSDLITSLLLINIGLGVIFFLFALFSKDVKYFKKSIPFIFKKKWILTLIYFLIFILPVLNDVFTFQKSETKINNQPTTLVPTETLTSTPIKTKNSSNTQNIAVKNSSGSIECIGPDGKTFNTSMDECKKLNEKWGKPVDYMVNCNIHPDCGGGTIRMSHSQCIKPCSGLSQQTNNTQTNNNSSVNNSNKTAVFLSYGGYTIYCPSQNVGAVQAINSTMESKKTQWAKDYNDCTSNFFKTDSCFVACVNTEKSKLNSCDSLSDSYRSCSDAALNYYSECIKTCPSASSTCDYVYWEQKNLSSQINSLCK